MSTQDGEVWTVQKLLNWTKDYFARCGLESPRLSAEVLLAHVLNCRRIDLYTRFDSQPTDEQRSGFRELTQRAAAHEPVAYLVGRKEFYSMSFRVTPDVLIPRPETELLVAEAIGHLKRMESGGRLWDVCTGCGCVAIAVAAQMRSFQTGQNEKLQALCTDISPTAVTIAAENARQHGLADCMHFRTADLLSLPDDCRQLAPFGVITANPPYVAQADEVAESVRYEPAEALYAGADGLDCIRRITAEAAKFLTSGGALVLEFGAGQADAVRDLIVATGRFGEPRICRDHRQIERAAVAVSRRGKPA